MLLWQVNLRPASHNYRFPSFNIEVVQHAHDQCGPFVHLQRSIIDTSQNISVCECCFSPPQSGLVLFGEGEVEVKPLKPNLLSGVHACCYPRILLCEDLGFFGPGSFENQLDASYKHFVSYCKQHGIQHSQPPFTPKLVLGPTIHFDMYALVNPGWFWTHYQKVDLGIIDYVTVWGGHPSCTVSTLADL